ncbi:MAG: Glutamate--tRNA ligase mitochondrial [Watsoniomyces obsoletus]|nr:MAG: Glutamate--tRNA ligase mitochondrial [Watsoniomyces obsoletus]
MFRIQALRARSYGEWVCRSCARRISTESSPAELKLKNNIHVHWLRQKELRTRFAPSPTGHLHLGSLRTALFNFLLAKASGGQFILRIEDTDKKRIVPGAEEQLIEDLRWAGIKWDEGPDIGGPYGPYKQSERTALYQEHAKHLLESGHAYRCFCVDQQTYDRTQKKRASIPGEHIHICAELPREEVEERAAQGERHVLRLLVNTLHDLERFHLGTNTTTGQVPSELPVYRDTLGRGQREWNETHAWEAKQAPEAVPAPKLQEHIVLLKSDGMPTYHLANVVDDHFMGITTVVRGKEWMQYTAKHVYMYNAFGWKPPDFAHLGLLHDEKGEKLSKRNGATEISAFRDRGVLPQALVNFVALLGWSHEERSDYMQMSKLIKRFSTRFTRAKITVSLNKLWYLQKLHTKELALADGPAIARLIDQICDDLPTQIKEGPRPDWLAWRNIKMHVRKVFLADVKNFTQIDNFLSRNEYFFAPIILSHYQPPPCDKHHPDPIRVSDLVAAADHFKQLSRENWMKEHLSALLHDLINGEQGPMKLVSENLEMTYTEREDFEKQQLNFSLEDLNAADKKNKDLARRRRSWNRALYHYLRWALAEGKTGPSVLDILDILGRDETLNRLAQAAALVGSGGGKGDQKGPADQEDEVSEPAMTAAV